jgi:subtilisin-like proprotein convertase family protein
MAAIRPRLRRGLPAFLAALAALLLVPSLASAGVDYVSYKAKDVGPTADGVIGPGDTVDLTVTVHNPAPTPVTGPTATLAAAPGSGVTVLDGSTAFPDLAPDASGQNPASDPLRVRLPALSCGDVVHLSLAITAAGQPTSVAIALPTGLPGVRQSFLPSGGLPLAVPDGGEDESALTVPSGVVRDVRVRVGGLEAGAVGDLELALTPPGGEPITLLPDGQVSGTGLSGTVFAAKGPSIVTGSAPYTGTFAAPRLADLIGRSAAGTWTLRVTDTTSTSGGATLTGWAIEVAPASCEPQAVANLTASAAFAGPGVPVTFDASESTSPDDSPLSFAWKVDGTSVPGGDDRLTRSWLDKGVHTVEVTVSAGEYSATAEASVVVTVPPTAVPTVTPSSPVSFDQVTLDATGSSDPDGAIASYEWDLDADGRYEHFTRESTIPAAFTSSGPRAVRLRVTDDLGATAVASVPVTVRNRPPTGDVKGPAPALTGEPATLDASGAKDLDGTIRTYEWTFGDDTEPVTTTAPTVQHTFGASGLVTVGVRVTDDAGDTASATAQVRVTRRPVVSVEASPESGRPGDEIVLTASGTDPDGEALTYHWDLPGATSCADPAGPAQITTTFATFADHRVTVCAKDVHGAVGTASVGVKIVNDPPTASFTATPNPVLAGAAVTFDASASSDADGPLAAYRWDVDGDGLYETSGVTATRAYPNPGTFEVRLQVTDSDGAKRSAAVPLVVQAPPGAGGTGSGGTGGTGTGGGTGSGGTGSGGSGSGGSGSGGGYGGSSAGGFRVALGGSPIQRLKDVRRKGLALSLTSDRPATLTLRATIRAADARRLGIARTRKARQVVAGTLKVRGRAGATRLRLRLSKAVARRLGRARRVTLVLDGRAVDASGRSVRLTRVVLVRR